MSKLRAFAIEKMCSAEGITNGFANFSLSCTERELELDELVSSLVSSKEQPLKLVGSYSSVDPESVLKIEKLKKKIAELSINVRPVYKPKKSHSLRRMAMKRSARAAETENKAATRV